MRLRATASLLIAAAALAGCAAPVERPGRLGMGWIRGDNPNEGVKLVLGVPNTDDLRLMLACAPHSGEVRLTVVSGGRPPAVIELHSGKLSGRYPGAGVVTDLGTDTEIKLSVDDPVLRHFADTGRLTVVFDNQRIVAPNAFGPGHDFLVACGMRPALG